MPIVVRHYLGRSALRNSDQRLVPAIIACNFSVCFLLFGVFLTISGVIFRSIAASTTSNVSINIENDTSRTAVTVGTVILSVGSVLAAIGLALLIFAWVSFKRYEAIRSSELHAAHSTVSLNYETSFTTAGHYPPPSSPPNAFSQNPNGYRSQQLYTIQDDFEPPPSYSTLPQNHEVINQSDK